MLCGGGRRAVVYQNNDEEEQLMQIGARAMTLLQQQAQLI